MGSPFPGSHGHSGDVSQLLLVIGGCAGSISSKRAYPRSYCLAFGKRGQGSPGQAREEEEAGQEGDKGIGEPV